MVYMSHPMWVRGLKHLAGMDEDERQQSHPMWVRGLKQTYNISNIKISCRTLCGCVD